MCGLIDSSPIITARCIIWSREDVEKWGDQAPYEAEATFDAAEDVYKAVRGHLVAANLANVTGNTRKALCATDDRVGAEYLQSGVRLKIEYWTADFIMALLEDDGTTFATLTPKPGSTLKVWTVFDR